MDDSTALALGLLVVAGAVVFLNWALRDMLNGPTDAVGEEVEKIRREGE